MKHGGNAKWRDFMREYGLDESLPIKEKYSSQVGELYKEKLKASMDGAPWNPPPRSSVVVPRSAGKPAASAKKPAARNMQASTASRPAATKTQTNDDDDWGDWEKALGGSGSSSSSTKLNPAHASGKGHHHSHSESQLRGGNKKNFTPSHSKWEDDNNGDGWEGWGDKPSSSNQSNSRLSHSGGYEEEPIQRPAYLEPNWNDDNPRRQQSRGPTSFTNAPTPSGAPPTAAAAEVLNVGISLLGDGLSKLSTVALTAANYSTEIARTTAERISNEGIANTLADTSTKGWQLVSEYWTKAVDYTTSDTPSSYPSSSSSMSSDSHWSGNGNANGAGNGYGRDTGTSIGRSAPSSSSSSSFGSGPSSTTFGAGKKTSKSSIVMDDDDWGDDWN
eukprot:TRINITY_DN2661_c0_g1_i2.p1 TRINITY_DN2661_c0_g1~~TRINITY_DN2661_c0_g1_i2.p1  ORF type:complete len:389 (-),score=116.49 TRINITY_DN2661_c0_g1_i2:317-1483(-)